MIRISLILFLLAGTVLAGPGPGEPSYGSWKAVHWGQGPTASKLPAEGPVSSGQTGANCNQLNVYAGATASLIDANLSTSATESDQERQDKDESTAWFGLKFADSPNGGRDGFDAKVDDSGKICSTD